MHDGICVNPLDMSLDKFNKRKAWKSQPIRDLNPLGHALRRESVWQNRKQAEELLEGKQIDRKEAEERSRKILKKYNKYVQLVS